MLEATPSDGVHLVTGTAGFIGFHLAERLLQEGRQVVGVDIVNDYYDPTLKEARLDRLGNHKGFLNHRIKLEDREALADVFAKYKPRVVVNLAAQAGVRYSLEHLVYASSSSVYGLNSRLPFSVGDTVDHPISLYAASKKSNELMAHTYSHLFGIPTTGLRFFTVYGPWGRPDMAMFLFARAILAGEPINVFNHGRMQRDFTYIDDIVEGVTRIADRPARPNPNWSSAEPDPGTSSAPYRLQNIGNNNPVELMYLIQVIEEKLGKKAEKIMLPIQPGDVPATYANVDPLIADAGFKPETSIEEGVANFIDWYRWYYEV